MQNLPSYSRDFLNKRHRLSHQQIDDLLNENFSKDHLQEKYDQLFQVNEFLNLTDQFREANISFIPLKGPILSYRLHKDASYRYSNDLDLLIPINAVKKAISVLEKNGYQPSFFSWPANPIKERLLIKFNNQIEFSHLEKQLNIDIHWNLFNLEITNSGSLDEVMKLNVNQILFNQRNFKVLNNELELLYLIIHGGLHAWFRLKWLVDIKDFIDKIPIEPEKFTRLAENLNASRMVSLCNEMLATYFPSGPQLPCTDVLSQKKRLKFTISQIENVEIYFNQSFLTKIKFQWCLMGFFPGLRFKLSVLASIFYTRYLSIFEFHSTSQHTCLEVPEEK